MIDKIPHYRGILDPPRKLKTRSKTIKIGTELLGRVAFIFGPISNEAKKFLENGNGVKYRSVRTRNPLTKTVMFDAEIVTPTNYLPGWDSKIKKVLRKYKQEERQMDVDAKRIIRDRIKHSEGPEVNDIDEADQRVLYGMSFGPHEETESMDDLISAMDS
jgi:hypothetical protein